MKICGKCKVEKQDTDYYSNGSRRRSYCKICSSLYQKEHKTQNEERLRKQWQKASKKYYTLKTSRVKTYRRYGLSVNDYFSLLEKQNGKCKVCNEEKKLVIDHNHKTGKVRGLLCLNCNTALGHLKDNKEIMLSAIKYLEFVSRA